MGFLDKAKEAADRAMAATQQAAQQGQAKIASVQSSRSEADLLRALGEAFYAEQRRGTDRAAVIDALNALDQHYAGTGTSTGPSTGVGTPTGNGSTTAVAADPLPGDTSGARTTGDPEVSPPPPAPTAAPAPAGNFTLDDF